MTWLAVLACLFNLQDLVDLMALATLFAFAIVASCIIVLRYQPEDDMAAATESSEVTGLLAGVAENQIRYHSQSAENVSSVRDLILRRVHVPTLTSGKIASWTTVVYSLAVLAFCLTVSNISEALMKKEVWAISIASGFAAIMVVCLMIIQGLPQSPNPLAFRVSQRTEPHPEKKC